MTDARQHEVAGDEPAAKATPTGEQCLVTAIAPFLVTTAMRCAMLTRDRDDARDVTARPLDVGFRDPMRDQLRPF